MSSAESLSRWDSFKLWNSENPSAKWFAIGGLGLAVITGIVAMSVLGGFEHLGQGLASVPKAVWINYVGAPALGILTGVGAVKGIQALKKVNCSLRVDPDFSRIEV
jgi:uncharacterized membrane protein